VHADEPRGRGDRGPVLGGERATKLGDGLVHPAEIHFHVLAELQGRRAHPLHHGRAERAPELRQQDVEALGVPAARRLAPHRFDQLVARDRPVVVERQVRQRQPPLPARQVAFAANAGELDRHAAAETERRGNHPGGNPPSRR
jgi:hypothetical protein